MNYYVRYYVDDDLRLNIIYNDFKKNVLNNIWSQKDKDEFCKGNILKVLHPTLFLSIYIILCLVFGLIFILIIRKYYRIYYSKNNSFSKSEDNENNNSNKKRKLEEDKNNVEDKEMELIQ